MLNIVKLSSYYNKIEAIKEISFQVKCQNIVTILGANGAGKSTTLKSILGLIRAKKGEIIFDGNHIESLSTERIVRLGISIVPEGRRVFPELDIIENLKMGAYSQKSSKNIQADIQKVFDIFPILSNRRRQIAITLSGGEQQMLAVARGLMSHPKLLLLDEPSLGLAPLIIKELFHTIGGINHDGITILLVEQNAEQAIHISHYAYVMENGKIVTEGTAEKLREDGKIQRSYLGY
jgi:branched-chain amino acid transport system ATP-binding protein